jgi:ribosomal protein L16 Arg81 hydroxylase
LYLFICGKGNDWGVDLSANIYVTSPQGQGFNWHYDDHDLFILQLKWNKTWNILEEESLLPEANFKSKSPQIKDTEHSTQLMLKEGNTLYMPRGTYHKAVTGVSSSVHISLSIYSVKTYQLFNHFLQQVRKEKLFRKSLVSANSSKLDKQEILAAAKDFALNYFSQLDLDTPEKSWNLATVHNVAPTNRNRLTSILNINSLSLDPEVRLNPGIVLDISSDKKFIIVEANGKKLKFPSFMQDVVLQLISSDSILPRELIKSIPERHALELTKQFIIEGFIIIES